MGSKNSISSRDVAKEAGVSQATVSYILNNVKDIKVKPETRQAVLDAVKKLNYHPNQIARGMKLKKSMSIGVVTDRNVTNFYFMKALEGIRDGFQEENYSITLLFNKHETIEEAEFIRYYNSNRIDGVIFVFASIDDDEIEYMNGIGLPYVIVDTYASGRNIYEVCTDHLAHIQSVVNLFKSKELKNIAYVGPISNQKIDKRFEAFKNALDLNGYPLREDFIVRISHADNEEVFNAIKNLFGNQELKPDAIIAGSPRYGMMAVKSCLMMGLKVPQEVSVVAIGSSNFFELFHPAISSIDLPLYDMGFNAAAMLLKIINGNAEEIGTEKTLLLPSELTLRESL